MSRLGSTEDRLPASFDVDRMATPDVLAVLHEAESTVDAAVARALPALEGLVDAVATALAGDGRLLYVGAGTSGRLGALDAAECPPTFGTDPGRVVALVAGGPAALTRAVEGAEDDRAAGRAAIAGASVGPADVVVGIAASGTTPFVRAALEEAGRRRAARALVTTNDPPGPIDVEHLIVAAVGPEAVAGSTRLKSATATKRILNLVTTAAMIRLGKVYRGWMVDLVATNDKLRRRSNRIVREVLGVDDERAAALLEASGDPPRVKVALVMGATGADRPAALARLADAGGHLHRILE